MQAAVRLELENEVAAEGVEADRRRAGRRRFGRRRVGGTAVGAQRLEMLHGGRLRGATEGSADADGESKVASAQHPAHPSIHARIDPRRGLGLAAVRQSAFGAERLLPFVLGFLVLVDVAADVMGRAHVGRCDGLAVDQPRPKVRFAHAAGVSRLAARRSARRASRRARPRVSPRPRRRTRGRSPPRCKDASARCGRRGRAAGRSRPSSACGSTPRRRRLGVRLQRAPRLRVVAAGGRRVAGHGGPVAEQCQRQAALDGLAFVVLLEQRRRGGRAARDPRLAQRADRARRSRAAAAAAPRRRSPSRALSRLQHLFVLLARALGQARLLVVLRQRVAERD